jgi:cytochrome o ubiquinol oxidase operon protein cyoD
MNSVTRKTYVTGFVLSLGLTMAAYLLVWRHVHSLHSVFSDSFLYFAVASLAIVQLLVQLIFFLHLGNESKPRWNLYVLSLAAIVVLILVFGSLWIMWNLDYHHIDYGKTHDGHSLTSPSQTESYIKQDEGIR